MSTSYRDNRLDLALPSEAIDREASCDADRQAPPLGSPASLPASLPSANLHQQNGSPARPTLIPSVIPASAETSRAMRFVESPGSHLGWHSRGYLPHWDHPGMIQSLGFRLHDALPVDLINRWKNELVLGDCKTNLGTIQGKLAGTDAGAPSRKDAENDVVAARGDTPIESAGIPAGESSSIRKSSTPARDPNPRQIDLRKRIAKYEDAGHGACFLRDPRIAQLIEGALLRFDAQRYRLIAWCVMPNHVHVIIETWEGWPLAGNLHSWKSYTSSVANKILGRTGAFWLREYHDRFIRDAGHYAAAIRYVEENPAKAGLVKSAIEWPFSSARQRCAAPPGSAGIRAGESPPEKPIQIL